MWHIGKWLLLWGFGLLALGEAGLHASHGVGIAVWLIGGIASGIVAGARADRRTALAHAHRVYQDEQIRAKARHDLAR